ncbi:mitochondrial heat shock protein Hsp10 [Basidiobolus ranarum]|uniref:Mitochondrial heat shock protein Hsp10 n=1 Tax=Basidiobolus ranarum TaxID=34480 RepID=A0ABR2VSU7_9FUNG
MASRAKQIIPLLDRILVQRVKAEHKTASGILIPEKAQETLNEGRVIAIGKGALDRDGKHIPVSVKEGDKVLLPPYGGSVVKVDKEEFLLLRDSEILAKIEEF